MNAKYSPSINTGEYGDKSVADEFSWAAAELFLLTQADSFAIAGNLASRLADGTTWKWPGGSDVEILGWLDLLAHPSLLTGKLAGSAPTLRSRLLGSVDSIRDFRSRNAYRIPMGGFWWGSNSVFANNGMLLWNAWKASGDTSYRNASLEELDYLLGRNATGYCWVTGFGRKSPLHPHHRLSGGDGVAAPEPGFLVGGGNPGQEDKSQCSYYSKLGPKSYKDDQNCYASNEVAINWNAPLAFLAGMWATGQAAVPVSVQPRASVHSSSIVLRPRSGGVDVALKGAPLASVDVLSPDGRILAHTEAVAGTAFVATGPGVSLVRAVPVDGAASVARFAAP